MGVSDIGSEVSQSIKNGIDAWVVGIVDGVVQSSVSKGYGVEGGNHTVSMDAIFSIATYTPNPFAMGFLDGFRDTMRALSYDLWWYLILFAMIIVLITYFMGLDQTAATYTNTGVNLLSSLKLVTGVIIGGIVVLMFEMAFVWITLLICDEMTKAVMMGTLNAIVFTPDNIPLYTVMGFAYAALWLCFQYRVMVIMFFWAVSAVIGMLLFFPLTRAWATNAHYYFIQITFFQFFIVLWYSFCILVIQGLQIDGYSMYIIMVLTSIWMAYKFIFKIDFIRSAGMVTRIVLIKNL